MLRDRKQTNCELFLNFQVLEQDRREWMGVEPTAARNATRRRF